MSEARGHLLYIDDDEGLRRLVERAMTRRGYGVRTAASGPEGMALLRDGQFDLVAIDHYMPGQDGLAVLAEVRAMPSPPPVVYVTGSDETQVAVAALKAGASDYVVKTVGESFFDLLDRSFAQAREKVALAEARNRAERELRDSHARLEALLGEVHHRVANSLQLVSAFVSMRKTGGCSPETAEALAAIQRRIEAIGQVHRRLYTSNHYDAVRLDEYLHNLITDIARSHADDGPRLTLSAVPVTVKPDRAIAAGVIVAELVSNAFKYAYPDVPGEIRVRLEQSGPSAFVVSVEDDGIGIPAEIEIRGTGLGMRVTDAMARSLGGVITRQTPPRGTAFTLNAPIDEAA